MLEILIGPIASGKSSYVQERAGLGHIVINDDAFTMALHAGNYGMYDKALKPMYKAVEMAAITHAICLGKDVIIDRPNMTKSCRMKYIGIAAALDTMVTAVMFEIRTPDVHARRRMSSDPRGKTFEYWEAVAKFQIDSLDIPLMAEGFENIVPAAVAREMIHP